MERPSGPSNVWTSPYPRNTHMMRASLLTASAALAFGLVVFTPSSAHADVLSSCGNLDFAGNETCSIQTSGGCTAQCTPISFQASCSAQLEVGCQGMCTASADVNCTGSCSGSCEA